MRYYEIVLIVHPDRSEQIPNMLKRYQGLITEKNGIVHRLEDWGRRPLAYPIRKIHKGHYILMNIACVADILSELEHTFKFNDAILRHLIIKTKQAITEPSVMFNGSEKVKNLLAPEEKMAHTQTTDAVDENLAKDDDVSLQTPQSEHLTATEENNTKGIDA
ncbi:MAG: 30S ribosomal protein S6 [Neisseriales bacterium]|nr:MAG: 30S ribosomal protein S6 [Neisseriales bacterium]